MNQWVSRSYHGAASRFSELRDRLDGRAERPGDGQDGDKCAGPLGGHDAGEAVADEDAESERAPAMIH